MIGNRYLSVRRLLALGALASLAAGAQGVAASAEGPAGADLVQGEIRAGWTRPDGTHVAALHLRLADGWMTYWRVPGDAGLPMRLDWSGSTNVAALEKLWPAPRMFEANGLRLFGFRDELILPVLVTPVTPGQPVVLDAEMVLAVCREVCIAMTMHLAAQIASGGGAPSVPDPLIATAMAAAPARARDAGLSEARCRISVDEDNRLHLSAELDLPATGANERVIVEMPGDGLNVRNLTTRRDGGVLRAEALVRARARPAAATAAQVDSSLIRLTVLSDSGALEHVGCRGLP